MPEPLKLRDIKLRMQAYGVHPRKKLGQNFLADFNLLKAIVADADIDKGDCVLEVGTGAGSLTGYLCDAAGLVISVEIDSGMFEMARDILEGTANLVQVRADALNRQGRGLDDELVDSLRAFMDSGELPILDAGPFADASNSNDHNLQVHSHLPGKPPRCGRLKMVANLPYSVATSVLIAALESQLPFERMVVMVQLDVAEKLAAGPGTKHWGLPSLLRHCFADAVIKRKVPPKVFWPKPKVESALLEITPRRDQPDMPRYHKLRRFAHVLFQHRRKAGANALAIGLRVDNGQAAEWIEQAGGDPQSRPEQLAPEVLQRLADDSAIEPLVRKAMSVHEDQLAERAAKRARRAEWKRRVYGES